MKVSDFRMGKERFENLAATRGHLRALLKMADEAKATSDDPSRPRLERSAAHLEYRRHELDLVRAVRRFIADEFAGETSPEDWPEIAKVDRRAVSHGR